MKGLLIKDYKLLMLQKKTFLLILLIAICMNFAMQDNQGVIIGYLTFFAALMANTTLSKASGKALKAYIMANLTARICPCL